MKPIIFGFKGLALTEEEKAFFAANQPAGFIIFKRNIESKDQLKTLCSELSSLFPGRETMILIDQEGGRVQRFTEPHTKKYPAPSYFRDLVEIEGKDAALKACYESNLEMALELREIGINVNCTPVADLSYEGASNVIGDRSFGSHVAMVIEFCKQVITAHLDAGIRPIIKHMPGHGRAKQDSHLELPIVDSSLAELEATDFAVFRELSKFCDFAMTAHIIYNAIDPAAPATISSKVISYVREAIEFKGEIITDCLTMEALSGGYGERATKALEAGCNYLLHCSGDMEQMGEIGAAVSDIK